MGQLMHDELQKVIDAIPDADYDFEEFEDMLFKSFPRISEEMGFVVVESSVLESPDQKYHNRIPLKRTYPVDLEVYSGEIKEVRFDMGNGGVATFKAAAKTGVEWSSKMEKDFYTLCKMGFLLYGRTRAMRTMRYLLDHDTMTGIYNRKKVLSLLEKMIEEKTYTDYYINFMNIKNMKLINGRIGDKKGDWAMIQFAQKVSEFLEGRGFVARLGGDMFVALVHDSVQDAFLDQLATFKLPMELNGVKQKLRMETRVGYYKIQPLDTAEDMMNRSSLALKEARNPAVTADVVGYQDDMEKRFIRERGIATLIPKAIEKEEFVVYYQPKVDLNGRRLIGAEALVRWRHEGIMISPGEFIPILERNGMVEQIDYYVLEHACQDIKRWEEMGLHQVVISTNFSRRHLRDPQFAEKIMEIVNRYEVSPQRLEIEITESYSMEDIEALKAFEAKMHAMGLHLSVDDFGSGFSSLNMLKNVSADMIKLDKSIIDGIGNSNATDEIIVKNIITMIRELDKGVIAEGVETERQAAFLERVGCTFIQGYLFDRPLPRESFEQRLRMVVYDKK